MKFQINIIFTMTWLEEILNVFNYRIPKCVSTTATLLTLLVQLNCATLGTVRIKNSASGTNSQVFYTAHFDSDIKTNHIWTEPRCTKCIAKFVNKTLYWWFHKFWEQVSLLHEYFCRTKHIFAIIKCFLRK